jgi:hypothetical protein
LDRYQQQETKTDDVDKVSPDSVEVIPEEDDEEDMSVADDSYTSASESTTATTTIMEQPPLPFSGGKTDSDLARSPHHKPYSVAEPSTSNDSSLYSSTVSVKTDSGDMKSPLASTRSSQHSLSLLDSSYNESLILTEVQPKMKVEEPILTHGSGRTGLTLLLAHGEVPSATALVSANEEGALFLDSKTERSEVSYKVGTCANDSSNEEGSSLLSDSRTLIPMDSSCDGTSAMESSSEDTTGTMVADDSSNEGNSKATFQQTSSFYVKTMLADAMGEDVGKESGAEQLMPARDQSPISSERFVLQVIT